eukprot:scaffold200_cov173-Amphora_coffeaeformis.AAC.18
MGQNGEHHLDATSPTGLAGHDKTIISWVSVSLKSEKIGRSHENVGGGGCHSRSQTRPLILWFCGHSKCIFTL